MSDGSSGPLTGIKIGKAPAHRSNGTPSSVTPSTSEVDMTTSDQISEHALPGGSTSTNGSSNGSSFAAGRHPSPDRRTAMGIASIRIAGRLTQNEITSRDTRPMDSSTGPDELLQLLGEYLTSGGLASPELHVRSNGTTVVLDLQNPAKGFR
ncbi:hypothetical protein HQ325_06900 [Rhodococcus sp. BP-349]|nr:hypothetical protein [Rhodococcus sp. BP-363]MBY6542732.1 hypothetical protein [Rhodococcus sp. BP-369]MBY6561962.1 hypothetical protein [Rhodococcus sp. BP-370]MBY6576254.1 hypothetical protein [Rhodococcus sp. BP-364]MBY6585555.1 hypothetical protein [Rhodococcus sp. BP-358]MBY6589892.1 hypothetical protein [Rhodococcus sp. BP-362]MBY6593575.1 hypothetical protein [Rhodococcus sp. BP-359]MBY6598568.1 hypothetical protein [Rhodococcus sp. BP-353]MBY6602252.1 hypothetical protein [Rhodoc